MKESTLVTVTVCARDGAHWVNDCLDAIHAQTHRPLEIIAVNDGSTDATGSTMDQWKRSNEASDVSISIILEKIPLELAFSFSRVVIWDAWVSMFTKLIP